MLGARIAALRHTRRWSQQELAKKLGVSASAVGMYEQGRREPDCETLVALARLFGVSTDYLLTGRTHAADLPQLRAAYAAALTRLDGTVLLQAADGSRRAFDENDLAMLLAAVLG